MKRLLVLAGMAVALSGADLWAQAVPDNSQASTVESSYRRPLNYRMDPFRNIFAPRWGVVLAAGAWAENNALNLKDVRALEYIDSNDTLLVTDLMDVLGLIPQGAGLGVSSVSEGGLYLGGPIGGLLNLGISAQGRAYGGGIIDDDAIAPFRDGNGSRQEFALGNSRGEGLATGEVGVHALFNFGPIGSVDGARVSLGVGARYMWPQAYARGRSIGLGDTLRLTPDTISASLSLETLVTEDLDDNVPSFDRGSGMAGDLMLRIEWPTSGFAIEGLLANVGKVKINGVTQRTGTLDVTTTNLVEFADSLDALEWDSTLVDMEVNLPRLVRFAASGWANRILQLDIATTFGLNSGEYEIPLAVDLGTTWRLVRALPFRLGLVVGGHQGFGYTGGVAVETEHFFLQFAGGSLGGLFGNATGAAGRFDLGFFF